MARTDVTTPSITGPSIVNGNIPQTMVTREIQRIIPTITAPPRQPVNIVNPFIVPKGPTNRFLYISNVDIYRKLFGSNISRTYGVYPCYAKRALENGVGAGIINLRHPDATHANFVVNCNVENSTTLRKIYYFTDATGGPTGGPYTTLYATLEEATADGVVTPLEMSISPVDIKFVTKSLSGLKDFTMFTTEAENSAVLPALSTEPASVPIHGMAYAGAGEFGNSYSLNVVTANKIKMNGKVYYQYISRIDQNGEGTTQTEDTLQYVLSEELVGTSGARVPNITESIDGTDILLTDTDTVEQYNGYLMSNNLSNKLITIIKVKCSNLRTDIRNGAGLTTFDEEQSNITEFLAKYVDPMLSIFNMELTNSGNVLETAVSTLDICAPIAVDPNALYSYVPAAKVTKLMEGTDPLSNMYKTPFDMGTKVLMGQPAVERKPYEELFCKFYDGTIDKSIYDYTVVENAIILGHNYTRPVQTLCNMLVWYNPDEISEKTRSESWAYGMTPYYADVATFNDAIAQANEIAITETAYNDNMQFLIGNYDVVYDGVKINVNPYFDYIAKWRRYFDESGVRPFAYGDYSLIDPKATNLKLIATGGMEVTGPLTEAGVSYLFRVKEGYKLQNDMMFLPDFMRTPIDHMGAAMKFNRALLLTTTVARSNQTIYPTQIEVITNQMNVLLEKEKMVPKFDNIVVTAGIGIGTESSSVIYRLNTSNSPVIKSNRVIGTSAITTNTAV